MSYRALIAVTHLLGVGHLTRAAALARGLVRAGWQVTLASGGEPARLVDLAGVALVQLPPVHCRASDFTTLLGPDGLPASAAMMDARRELLVATLRQVRPHALVSELYPFGRRQLRAEFEALLAAAAGLEPRPAALCSLRDVPNPPSKPARAQATLETLGRFFDAVLVHGDKDFVPLDAAWPVDAALARRLRYTGYVHEAPASANAPGSSGEILVSGGGSAASLPLGRAALEAARLTPALRWRVLLGHGIGEADFATLVAAAPENAVVERARADFQRLLAACRVSVSQAGYNTVLDLAEAGARAVLVPFAEGKEQEQTIRAGALAARGLAQVLPAEALTAEALARTVGDVAARAAPDWTLLRRDGVARSVEIIGAEAARAAAIDEAWRRLDGALEDLAGAGRVVPAFLRDDDAVAPSEALSAFLSRMSARGVPVALAVIPAGLDPALGGLLEAHPHHAAFVHGYTHRSHAPQGLKTSEYPPGRDAAELSRELNEAWRVVAAAAPHRALPVFAPPWNRMASDAIARLAPAGYRALSAFASSRRHVPGPDVPRLDTHWDPIDWRGTRGLADEVMLLDRLAALLLEELEDGPHAPLGLLTHHAVHDAWIDRFLDSVIDRLRASAAVRFLAPADALAQVSVGAPVEVVGTLVGAGGQGNAVKAGRKLEG